MGDNFRLAMGLISGTSMDGIDACIIRINYNLSQGEINDFIVVDHMTVPYPHGLKEDLLRVGIEGSIKDVCLYQSLLGQLFSDAAKAMIKKLSIRSSDIYVIGSHGQTVLHLPNSIQLYGHSICGSLQLGDPSVIANQTGIITVGDFRTADIALGGQGAPLVPYLDHMLLRRHFSKTGRVGAFLNIGGISNIFSGAIADTVEDTECIGFDCGPGNVLIDSLMKHFYGREFDKDGTVASEGTVNENLLSWLMEDRFVLRCPPKSTGRELYNPDYVDNIIKKCKQEAISSRDCISTVTAFTAHAVHYNFKHYIQSLLNDWPDSNIDLFVSGGGYKNNALVKYLKECFKLVNVASTDELGIPCDAKEAACFAVLAYQAVTGHKNHLPCVTGASGPTILGKICLVKPPGSDCSQTINNGKSGSGLILINAHLTAMGSRRRKRELSVKCLVSKRRLKRIIDEYANGPHVKGTLPTSPAASKKLLRSSSLRDCTSKSVIHEQRNIKQIVKQPLATPPPPTPPSTLPTPPCSSPALPSLSSSPLPLHFTTLSTVSSRSSSPSSIFSYLTPKSLQIPALSNLNQSSASLQKDSSYRRRYRSPTPGVRGKRLTKDRINRRGGKGGRKDGWVIVSNTLNTSPLIKLKYVIKSDSSSRCSSPYSTSTSPTTDRTPTTGRTPSPSPPHSPTMSPAVNETHSINGSQTDDSTSSANVIPTSPLIPQKEEEVIKDDKVLDSRDYIDLTMEDDDPVIVDDDDEELVYIRSQSGSSTPPLLLPLSPSHPLSPPSSSLSLDSPPISSLEQFLQSPVIDSPCPLSPLVTTSSNSDKDNDRFINISCSSSPHKNGKIIPNPSFTNALPFCNGALTSSSSTSSSPPMMTRMAARLNSMTGSTTDKESRESRSKTPPYSLSTVITTVSSDSVYYKTLHSWQDMLNSKRESEAPIFIENLYDDEPPPSNFTYITSNIHREGVPGPIATALVGCNCLECSESNQCCPDMAGLRASSYTKDKRVKAAKGTPIYECNFMCSCGPSCYNRVVQFGRQFPVCIFRTANGRGWGVKTCLYLKRGTFITEYMGEVITTEEAERRGIQYDMEGSTYLFDLDFDEDQSDFTIDAGYYGNISHFFNHSCSPNLQVFSVWIQSLDPRLPQLALFAKRDIGAGEELTFDYKMGRNLGSLSNREGRVPCLCGSKKCRGFLN